MTFIEICKKTQKDLKQALVAVLKFEGYKPVVQDGFIYAEGTVPVLLVAHMDTVHHDRCTIICESTNGYIMSPQGIGGDDRCGIYMILETIKELKCSVLFTEDEEIGCVGAEKFCKSGIEPSVPLNYIIEYDRKGSDDAVFYDCDNPEFEDFITDKEIGFKTAFGSCSDISDVAPHLGLAAVNLSCGYYNQHTQHEYVKVNEMERNIERGKQLIRKPCEKFVYIEAEPYSKYKYYDYYGSYGYGSYGSYGSYNYYKGKNNDSKKTNSKGCWDDYSNISDIYENIDEVAIQLYEESCATIVQTKSLVPVTELYEWGKKEMVVSTEDNKIPVKEYCCPDILYMDIKDSSLYIIDSDNSYGISVAVMTDDYITYENGDSVLYFPDTLEEFPVMNAAQNAEFVEYVENFLEFDINEGLELGTLI